MFYSSVALMQDNPSFDFPTLMSLSPKRSHIRLSHTQNTHTNKKAKEDLYTLCTLTEVIRLW